MAKIIKKGNYKKLLSNVASLIEYARKQTVREVNTIITKAYWKIGRLIVEEEQKGEKRAEYGEQITFKLFLDLIKKFGKSKTMSRKSHKPQTLSAESSTIQKCQTVSDEFIFLA